MRDSELHEKKIHSKHPKNPNIFGKFLGGYVQDCDPRGAAGAPLSSQVTRA